MKKHFPMELEPGDKRATLYGRLYILETGLDRYHGYRVIYESLQKNVDKEGEIKPQKAD